MTIIDTEKKVSPNSIDALFGFLNDLNNFEQLMPQDKIEKWESSEEQCEFTIKGMARIGLKKIDSNPPNMIQIESFGKVPFTFTLDILLNQIAEDQTEAHIHFEGDINPFMKLMVEKPLTNFFSMLVDRASKLNL